MAKRFGKSGGFVAGMILLPVVFFPMLAFGKDAAIVNNQSNTSNENNMTDNTLGVNAAAIPNMNEQTMTSNEMVTPNNPVMSNPVGNAPFGNTSVESGLNSQNVNVGQNIEPSLESNQNISAMNEPVMPQPNDNVAPTFDNVAQDNVQMPVMPNTMDAAQNVNVMQNIGSSLESVQNTSAMDEPVMPQSNDNVTFPTFNNVAQDNVQMSVTPDSTDVVQNVSVEQNINSALEEIQNNQNMPLASEPVINKINDNAVTNAMPNLNEQNPFITEDVTSDQEEMLDINDVSDSVENNEVSSLNHTSLWSNNNQNNGQM